MTDNERQLLRAQLLIEAADLLDEAYNKPNYNDRIDAKLLKDQYDEDVKRHKEWLKMCEEDPSWGEDTLRDVKKGLARLKKNPPLSAKELSRISSRKADGGLSEHMPPNYKIVNRVNRITNSRSRPYIVLGPVNQDDAGDHSKPYDVLLTRGIKNRENASKDPLAQKANKK